MLTIQPIDVIFHNDSNGNIVPLQMKINNHFVLIDRIIEVKPAFSEAGGYGLCYFIKYQNHYGKLFFKQDHYELEYTVDPNEVAFPKPGIVADQ